MVPKIIVLGVAVIARVKRVVIDEKSDRNLIVCKNDVGINELKS